MLTKKTPKLYFFINFFYGKDIFLLNLRFSYLLCNKSGKSAFFNKFLYKRKKSEKWTFFYVQFQKNLRIIKKKICTFFGSLELDYQ